MHARPVRFAVRLTAVAATLACAVALVGLAPATAEASSRTPIMGPQQASARQLASWYHRSGQDPRLPVSVDELAAIFVEEGAAEGVRGDIAFMQSVLETGWFTFPSHGQVRPEHNNYGGIGAVDGGNSPNRFRSPRIGVRAQIQHLRAYADPLVTATNLAHPLESPRFHLVVPKGRAPLWEDLGGGDWATDPDYAVKILGLWSQLGFGPASPAPQVALRRSFRDVPAGHVHADAIAWATAQGLVQGSGGMFNPAHDSSRAQLASVLQRFHARAGEPVDASGPPAFSDVPAGHVHAQAIRWASDAGLLHGFSGNRFAPRAATTRAQLASLLHRYRGEAVAAESRSAPFSDVPADDVHGDAIAWAHGQGIVQGVGGGRFQPSAAVTRAQLVSMLERLDRLP